MTEGNIEFVRLPDGRYAAIVDTTKPQGETAGGNISYGKTGGAGAQIERGLYFQVNVWRKAPKEEKAPKLVEVKDFSA